MNNFQTFLAIDSSQAGQLVLRLITPSKIYDAPREIRFESGIIPAVDELLQQANIFLADIDAFILGRGPGSFMGLRLGFSVFRTWAWIHNTPIITLSSLDLLRISFKNSHSNIEDTIIIPCVDGKMKKVFVNIHYQENYYLTDSDITPEELAYHIKQLPIKNIVIIGNGASLIQEYLELDNISYFPEEQLTTTCFNREFIQSLDKQLFTTKKMNYLENIEPNYLRVSVAEEELLKKQKKDTV